MESLLFIGIIIFFLTRMFGAAKNSANTQKRPPQNGSRPSNAQPRGNLGDSTTTFPNRASSSERPATVNYDPSAASPFSAAMFDNDEDEECDDGYGSIEHTTHEGKQRPKNNMSQPGSLAQQREQATWSTLTPSYGSLGSSSLSGSGSLGPGSLSGSGSLGPGSLSGSGSLAQTGSLTGPTMLGSLSNYASNEDKSGWTDAHAAISARNMSGSTLSGDDSDLPSILGMKLDADGMKRAVILNEILGKRGGRRGCRI